MFRSVAKIPSVLSVDGPRATFFWGFMHVDGSAQRSKWCAVEIEGAIEVRCASEERSGCRRDMQRRFKVVVACGMRRSHRRIGKCLSAVHKHATK